MRDYGTLCSKWITSSSSSTRYIEGYMVEEEKECKCEVITLRKEWFPYTIGLTYIRTHRLYYTDPENIYSEYLGQYNVGSLVVDLGFVSVVFLVFLWCS